MTPRKLFASDYYNNIISPFKELTMKPILDTPFPQNNYIICSPGNNFRFNSPNNRKIIYIFFFIFFLLGFISSDRKTINDKNIIPFIQGKKIDFNEEIDYEIENKNNQNNKNSINIQNISVKQNILLNQNNKIYNNANNNNNILNQNEEDKNNMINQKNKIMNRSFNDVQPINANINVKILESKPKCTCSKTGCLKKYCACFAKNKFCEDCDCKNCENKPKKGTNNNTLEQNIINYGNNIISNEQKTQRIICNCTKSNCMKKYCECYKQNMSCNSLCRCIDCSNKNNINNFNNLNNCIKSEKNDLNLLNENNNNFSEVHGYSASYVPDTFGKSIDYNNPINFQSEAFCIYIKKEKLKQDSRKIKLSIINSKISNSNNNNYNISKEVELTTIKDFNQTPKFSNKKRARSKNDISNMRTCSNTNSSKRKVKGLSSVNKNIQKKKLQLN